MWDFPQNKSPKSILKTGMPLLQNSKHHTYLRLADGQVTIYGNNSKQTNACHSKEDI